MIVFFSLPVYLYLDAYLLHKTSFKKKKKHTPEMIIIEIANSAVCHLYFWNSLYGIALTTVFLLTYILPFPLGR